MAGVVILSTAHASDIVQDQVNAEAIASLERASSHPLPQSVIEEIAGRESPVRTAVVGDVISAGGESATHVSRAMNTVANNVSEGVKEGVEEKDGVSQSVQNAASNAGNTILFSML